MNLPAASILCPNSLSFPKLRTAVTRPSGKVLTIFGTRPELIKLAPVIHHLESLGRVQTVNVTSAQHTDILYPFIRLFQIRIDHDLQIMEPGQTLNQVCSRVLARLDQALAQEQPDLVLVQGDTTTAVAGALAGFHRKIQSVMSKRVYAPIILTTLIQRR